MLNCWRWWENENTALFTLVVVVKVMMMIVINGGWDKKLQHPNKIGGSGLIIVVTWMPCGHFNQHIELLHINSCNSVSSPSQNFFAPTITICHHDDKLPLLDIKSQDQIFAPCWRKRKLESDAISKFANWPRFPFVCTGPLCTLRPPRCISNRSSLHNCLGGFLTERINVVLFCCVLMS